MKLIVQTDGGSRGNPGPAACSCVISGLARRSPNVGGKIADNLRELHTASQYLGVTTNNVAEYSGVLLAYSWLCERKNEIEQVQFFLDSNLAVSQLNGVFKVKNRNILELVSKIREQEQEIGTEKISYEHVYREKNNFADRLVNLCLDAQKVQQ